MADARPSDVVEWMCNGSFDLCSSIYGRTNCLPLLPSAGDATSWLVGVRQLGLSRTSAALLTRSVSLPAGPVALHLQDDETPAPEHRLELAAQVRIWVVCWR
jgi:hypothetical protein